MRQCFFFRRHTHIQRVTTIITDIYHHCLMSKELMSCKLQAWNRAGQMTSHSMEKSWCGPLYQLPTASGCLATHRGQVGAFLKARHGKLCTPWNTTAVIWSTFFKQTAISTGHHRVRHIKNTSSEPTLCGSVQYDSCSTVSYTSCSLCKESWFCLSSRLSGFT